MHLILLWVIFYILCTYIHSEGKIKKSDYKKMVQSMTSSILQNIPKFWKPITHTLIYLAT